MTSPISNTPFGTRFPSNPDLISAEPPVPREHLDRFEPMIRLPRALREIEPREAVLRASAIPGTHVLVGSELDAYDTEALRQSGVTHMLLVGHETNYAEESSRLKSTGIQLRKIGVTNDLDNQLLTHIPRALEFIEDAAKAGGKVLIYGGLGVSRSTGIAVAYLMTEAAKQYHQGPNTEVYFYHNYYHNALDVVQAARAQNGVDAVPDLGISLALEEYNTSLGGFDN